MTVQVMESIPEAGETSKKVSRIRWTILIILSILGIIYLGTTASQVFHIYNLTMMPTILKHSGATIEIFEAYISFMKTYSKKKAVDCVIGFTVVIGLMAMGIMGKVWEIVSTKWFPSSGALGRSLVFLILWSLYDYIILSVELPLTATLVGQSSIIAVVIGAIGFGLIFYGIVKKFHAGIAFALVSILVVVYVLASTFLGIQVFLTIFPPLNPGPLRDSIFSLAKRVDFPVENIRVMPKMFNAFYGSGIFNEVIIIGSEFLNLPPDQVTAVVAHELGHRSNKDIIYFLAGKCAWKILTIGTAIFYVLPQPTIFNAFGFATEPLVAALPIAEFLVSILGAIVNPVKLYILRFIEYRADSNAHNFGLTKALIAFLGFFSKQQITTATTPFELLYLEHPTIVNRLERLHSL